MPPQELAPRVEELWQKMMKEYLTFTPYSRFVQAEKISHYMHLKEFNIIEQVLDEMYMNLSQRV